MKALTTLDLAAAIILREQCCTLVLQNHVFMSQWGSHKLYFQLLLNSYWVLFTAICARGVLHYKVLPFGFIFYPNLYLIHFFNQVCSQNDLNTINKQTMHQKMTKLILENNLNAPRYCITTCISELLSKYHHTKHLLILK